MDSQDKLNNEFGQELENLIQKYLDKNLDEFSIVYQLMQSLKINACCTVGDYHAMLGILTSLLTHDLREMFDEISKNSKEEVCAEKKVKTKKEKKEGKL